MKIWALSVIKEQIVSFNFLYAIMKFLEISYAEKNLIKIPEIWELKG